MIAAEDAAITDVLHALAILARLVDEGDATPTAIRALTLETAEITASHRGTLNESDDGRDCLHRAFRFIELMASHYGTDVLREQVADLERGGIA